VANFQANLVKCEKCGKEYTENHQSSECPHERLVDVKTDNEKKLNEKEIEKELAMWYCKRSLSNADWESLPSHVKAQFYDKTKELVDLVALAKKKAREEIIQEIEKHALRGENSFSKTILFQGCIEIRPQYEWWQALKGRKLE